MMIEIMMMMKCAQLGLIMSTLNIWSCRLESRGTRSRLTSGIEIGTSRGIRDRGSDTGRSDLEVDPGVGNRRATKRAKNHHECRLF